MLRPKPLNMDSNVFDPYNVIGLAKAHYTHPVARFDPVLQQNCLISKVIVSSSNHVPGGLGLWSDENGFKADSQITVMGIEKNCVISTDKLRSLLR
jgi:hypothetical protein